MVWTFKKKSRAPRVYISYSRRDGLWAARIREALAAHLGGSNVFYDLDSIVPGENFLEALTEAIRECDVVICLISPGYLDSSWARREKDYALSIQKPVIPVIIEEAALEGPIARYNALDLRPGVEGPIFEQQMMVLLEAVNRLAER